MHRSRLEHLLNVAHSESKLSWQRGMAGGKVYASGAFIDCGLADRAFEQPAKSLFGQWSRNLTRGPLGIGCAHPTFDERATGEGKGSRAQALPARQYGGNRLPA